jgi:hypothetical protein
VYVPQPGLRIHHPGAEPRGGAPTIPGRRAERQLRQEGLAGDFERSAGGAHSAGGAGARGVWVSGCAGGGRGAFGQICGGEGAVMEEEA